MQEFRHLYLQDFEAAFLQVRARFL
jgi:hypothetical protein